MKARLVLPALILLLGGGILFFVWAGELAEPPGDYVSAEIATLGLDQLSGSPVVVLQEQATGRLLPIWIGPAEAQAIAMVLEGFQTPRPMTHDLMKSIVEESNLRVEGIQIEKLEGNVYFAKLFGKKEGDSAEDDSEPFTIDSRPSDAMALALRLEVPIFVSESLLMEIPEFRYSPGGAPGRLRAFGLELGEATAEQRSGAGLPGDGPGLVVLGVSAGSHPEIQEGDLLSEANGKPLHDVGDLIELLRVLPDGEELQLKIHRGEEAWEVDMPLQPLLPPSDEDPSGLQV